MDGSYKGGCFSLKVPPVFFRNGNLIAIPKGRGNQIHIYETLGVGVSISSFSESNSVITGLGSIRMGDQELIVTATIDGLLKFFKLDDVLSQVRTPFVEYEMDYNIVDLKVLNSNMYFLVTGKDDSSHVSLLKLPSEVVSKMESDGTRNVGKTKAKFSRKSLKVLTSFYYGASTFRVSVDESLFCFIWKNIIIIWNTEYPDRIIRFRHSEYMLSLSISDNKQFIVTGDAYGRLTYWFIPPSSSSEGVNMWKDAPLVSEKSDAEKMIYKYNIKTITSHWHSHELTALSMIPDTEVVLSGGEEAVLVLWRQTFSSDSYVIRNKNRLKNQNYNGTRQFIPRLGAPIYTISPFKREREIYLRSQELQSAKSSEQDSSLPPLLAAIVCADNSIKILDLVHNKIVNSIYGVSTPFGGIQFQQNTKDISLKMLSSQFLDPRRLLVSLICHPSRLHIHDLIDDVPYSRLLCKPEESYVSKVGEGISSSKLAKEDITRVVLTNSYFSNNGKTAVTFESQRFDHMGGRKKVFNIKFWKINQNSDGNVGFDLVTKYPVAHTTRIISVEETKALPTEIFGEKENEESEESYCILTISSSGEIKIWKYKKKIKEWINSSIINGEDDTEVYSSCFSNVFNRLFLATSRGVYIFDWNPQFSFLSRSIYPSLKTNGEVLTQITSLSVMDKYFLLGFSAGSAKVFMWDLRSLKLVLEDTVESEPDSMLIQIRDYFGFEAINYSIPFQFAIVNDRAKGLVTFYELGRKTVNENAHPEGSEVILEPFDWKLESYCNIQVELAENTYIRDAVLQPRVLDSRTMAIYLVLLLSSCDIYTQVIGNYYRSGSSTQIPMETRDDLPKKSQRDTWEVTNAGSDADDKSEISHENPEEYSEKNEEIAISGLRESIEKIFFSSSSKSDADIRKGSYLENVSNTVRSIISNSKNEDANIYPDGKSSDLSLSSLFCIREGSKNPAPFSKKNLNGLSGNLNTCMCPSPSTLFWTLLNNNTIPSSVTSKRNINSHSQVSNFKLPQIVPEGSSMNPTTFFLPSEPLKPLQTQKLQSLLKKATSGVKNRQ
ncbi:WD40 repeat-like protein [Cryptosporidium felis]|nr:WD40 repeat-like protein [Cryptosporidium felis]